MDYKEMYFKLFNEITDVIEKLQNAQKAVEEMYIQAEEKEDTQADE